MQSQVDMNPTQAWKLLDEIANPFATADEALFYNDARVIIVKRQSSGSHVHSKVGNMGTQR